MLLTPAQSILNRKYGLRPHDPEHAFAKNALLAQVGRQGPSIHAMNPAPAGFTCDYQPMMRPIRDQGQEGSCGPHAWCGLKEFNCIIWALDQAGWTVDQPLPPVLPVLGDWLSVAHAYWNILKSEGVWPNDAGTDNATAGNVFRTKGVCPESFLPYVAGSMTPGNAQCDTAGAPYRIKQAISVPLDEAHIDAVLNEVKVLVLGFTVYASFETTGSDGIVPPASGGLLGGHDVVICGKTSAGLYKARNSWGSSWADGGYFYVSPAYVAQVGMDAWTTE